MAPERKTSGYPQGGSNPQTGGCDRGKLPVQEQIKCKKGLQMCKRQQRGGRGTGGRSHLRPLKCFSAYTELKPAHLPPFSGDWRAPPCILTASLCASMKTINSRPKSETGGSLFLPFSLSLFLSVLHFKLQTSCNLPAALSRPSTWFLHGTMENESKWKIEWKSKLSSGEQ